MKASDYRAQVEKELGDQAGEARAAGRLRGAAIAGDDLSLEDRRDLVRSAVNNRAELPTAIPALLAILADPAQPEPLRGSALASLKAASFIVTAFAPYKAEFIQTLHAVLKNGGPELRERALEVLAVEKDPEAQALLVRGLEKPEEALVPATTAVQYLSYDEHAAYAPVVRDLVERTDDEQVKEEGLRALSTDPNSQKLFSKLLSDSGERAEVRRLSAVALQVLNPERFEEIAQKIVRDDDEDDDVRATCLAALGQVRDYVRSRTDADFIASVETLKEKGSEYLAGAAARFMKRIR